MRLAVPKRYPWSYGHGQVPRLPRRDAQRSFTLVAGSLSGHSDALR